MTFQFCIFCEATFYIYDVIECRLADTIIGKKCNNLDKYCIFYLNEVNNAAFDKYVHFADEKVILVKDVLMIRKLFT